MPYIHELPQWPNFTWNAQALAQALAELRHKQGKHLGKLEALGLDLQTEANVIALTREIVASSALEGIALDSDAVRTLLASKLGLSTAEPSQLGTEGKGFTVVMLDATQKFNQPLTEERLWGWHVVLFRAGKSGTRPVTVGAWRRDQHGQMQVVSGPPLENDEARVLFQAPAAERLEVEMKRFLTWFNQPPDMDPVLQAAVAYLWFVTIHPFDDGNWRIALAIAELALARADGSKNRFYSMSAAIEEKRKMYLYQLKSTQRGSLDITSWLAWFLECLDHALNAADTLLAPVHRKARVWQRLSAKPVNDRQRAVIKHMLENDWKGHLSSSTYARLTECSPDTALRDIKELVEHGVVVKNESGGRSTSYRLSDSDAGSANSA